jgi:uncharacterized protein with PIN domain
METHKCAQCNTPMKFKEKKVIGKFQYKMYHCEKCKRTIAK